MWLEDLIWNWGQEFSVTYRLSTTMHVLLTNESYQLSIISIRIHKSVTKSILSIILLYLEKVIEQLCLNTVAVILPREIGIKETVDWRKLTLGL